MARAFTQAYKNATFTHNMLDTRYLHSGLHDISAKSRFFLRVGDAHDLRRLTFDGRRPTFGLNANVQVISAQLKFTCASHRQVYLCNVTFASHQGKFTCTSVPVNMYYL